MTADIEFLPNIDRGEDAVLHDALKRVPKGAKVIVLWEEDNFHDLNWTSNTKNMETAWMLHHALQKML